MRPKLKQKLFRAVANSWRPEEWREDSPWMRMFRNACVNVGESLNR